MKYVKQQKDSFILLVDFVGLCLSLVFLLPPTIVQAEILNEDIFFIIKRELCE